MHREYVCSTDLASEIGQPSPSLIVTWQYIRTVSWICFVFERVRSILTSVYYGLLNSLSLALDNLLWFCMCIVCVGVPELAMFRYQYQPGCVGCYCYSVCIISGRPYIYIIYICIDKVHETLSSVRRVAMRYTITEDRSKQHQLFSAKMGKFTVYLVHTIGP